MIVILFNENGYHVSGENVEATQRVSPATTNEGDKIFQPLHHTYKVLHLALSEIHSKSIQDDVVVYGDSRIIDELNGVTKPLDEVCEQWVNVIRRHVLPEIKAIVFFRKKTVNDKITTAHTKMIPDERTSLPQLEDQSIKTKREAVKRLKENWFYGKK